MATNVKCIWIFSTEAGYGWTESHYYLSSAQPPFNLNTILNAMDTVISPTRRVLLGVDTQIVGYRASYRTNTGIASLNRVVNLPGTQIGAFSGSPNDSLATTMIDASGTRKKIIHLRGIWNGVVDRDVFNPIGFAGINYQNLINKYTASLIAAPAWGWLGKDPNNSVFGVVTGYTSNATNQVTFTVATTAGSAALNTLIAAGMPATFECRISKINRSNSVLNRTFVVTPTVTAGVVTGLQTTNPVATGPFVANGRFNISIPLFIAYATAGGSVLGERRMGKVLGHYPGRARRRPEI